MVDADPADTVDARSGTPRLPLELTSFVGRRAELLEAKGMLSSRRLVTLTGIGGVGKTRLALRIAGDARNRGGPVWMVELGELRDGSLIVEVVAAALGLRHRARSPLAGLADHIAEQQALVVLDNCEQVIDAVAALSRYLLRHCPGLRILATSREALGVGGEAVLRVAPLEPPDPESRLRELRRCDAMTLFVDRAAGVVPRFELTETNASTVARICARLDGLPLALELAAATLRVMSPEQLLQRLSDRFRLLTRGERDAPTRQRTLRLCVDWSHTLCTPVEQRAWARLSTFPGSFDLDAAEHVCGGDVPAHELIDTLASLVDKSILVREQVGTVVRFRLLETLRVYGRERAREAGTADAQRQRHRDWYEQLTLQAEAEWIGPCQLDWIERLERDQPNLREALEYGMARHEPGSDAVVRLAAALYPFWLSRGRLGEGRRWLDRALDAEPGTSTALRARALYRTCALAGLQGDQRARAAHAEAALALAAQTTDARTQAFAAYADGLHALFSGDLPRACTRLESAHGVLAEHEDRFDQVGALITLGWAYELRGASAQALTCHEQALEITRARDELLYRSHGLWGAAVAVWRLGDGARATQLIHEALRLVSRRQDPFVAAVCLEALGWIAGAEGDPRRAAVLLGAAEGLGKGMGSSAVVFPDMLVLHRQCEQRARRELGERAFAAALTAGRGMDVGGSVDYALGTKPVPRTRGSGPASTELTEREGEVAALVAEGLTNKAIAARLVISQRTAQGHVERILIKLGFTRRTQIATWVVESRHERT
ncbi:ATP-binding protein [Pseudonocardia sp.]|uniref:ATP-binding protein n=1 Tax=Pseudonocardia sp. TaxID=60912 RepID=UPI003D12C2F8